MIVALHAATGAAGGALTRSRVAAIALGPLFHVAGDQVPHRHPAERIEYLTGLASIAILARRRGLFDAATIGAVAAVLPDLEHVILGPRRRSEKFFHRRPGRDRRDSGGLSTRAQLALAAAIIAPLVASTRGVTCS
jgi:hypothetical protein